MLALWEVYFSRKISMAFSPVAQLDIQLGGGMERAIILRVARKKCFATALNISREGGIYFSNFREN